MQAASLKTGAPDDAPDLIASPAPTAWPEPVRLHVEAVASPEIAAYRSAWADLVGRALEANIFLEPGFALPLLRHLLIAPRLRFLLVWEADGPASFGKLLGLFPMLPTRGGLAYAGIARGFAHNQVCSGVPLIDRDHAVDVLGAALAWIGDTRAAVLVLEQVPEAGAFFAVLSRVCNVSGRSLSQLDAHQRAVLFRGGPSGPPVSAKRRKEQARLFRRLSEMGARSYTIARTPEQVAIAVDRFVALEHRGWKGVKGTSFGSNAPMSRFLHEVVEDLSQDGKCRIDATEIDGEPVAMGLVLLTSEMAYYWKTAFDETYAGLSPGVQFTAELTHVQLAEPLIAVTDSCAIADHPMIDRVWPDRHTVVTLLVEIRPRSGLRFQLGCGVERLRRDVRRRAKQALSDVRRLAAGCKSRRDTRSEFDSRKDPTKA